MGCCQRKIYKIKKRPITNGGTEKVPFFQNNNIVIKKRTSRIASKARFLFEDTFKHHQIC